MAFVTAKDTADKTSAHLQTLADKELSWGNRHGAAFDRAKSQWMLLTHKTPPNPPLTIHLGDVKLAPQPRIKWLGVLLDPKLCFTDHVDAQVAKGITAANWLACLARTGWGIPLRQCKQLMLSLIHSRTDYASVVWH